MKKGDVRREQILLAAETLFYANGYEQTTVQDILDQLSLSKGGFYHHFDSKLSLLEAICELRAEESCRAAEEAVSRSAGDPVAQLNAMMESSNLLSADKMDYVGLLLRVAYREDGALMREKLKQRTLEQMLPLMNRVVEDGVREKVFLLPQWALAGELVLRLSAQFTDEVATTISAGGDAGEMLGAILAKLELYRHTVERMLSAPFGSVVLYNMENIAKVCHQLSKREGARA